MPVMPCPAAAGSRCAPPTSPPRSASAITPRACLLRSTCWSKLSIPAPASRQRSSTRYSCRSSRPKRLEKADGQIDLVVSDVVMPEMDGPTLLRELRNRNPSLKIIFVSGYAEDAFQKHLPEHGQFAFLPKPFTLKQLVAAVKDTLAA